MPASPLPAYISHGMCVLATKQIGVVQQLHSLQSHPTLVLMAGAVHDGADRALPVPAAPVR